MKMNLMEFYGSKIDKDPQDFIDEVYKVLDIMGVTLVEKSKLLEGLLMFCLTNGNIQE